MASAVNKVDEIQGAMPGAMAAAMPAPNLLVEAGVPLYTCVPSTGQCIAWPAKGRLIGAFPGVSVFPGVAGKEPCRKYCEAVKALQMPGSRLPVSHRIECPVPEHYGTPYP